MEYKAAIYMPSFNKGKYVMDAISSVAEQTASFPYLLYVLDHSTDKRTQEIVTNMQSAIVQVIHVADDPEKNQCIEGMNTFFDEIDAEYVFYLQDDDVLEKTFLADMVGELETGKDAVYCGMKFIRLNGTEELYTSDLIFPNTKQGLVGTMESFQIGLRKTVFEDMEKPYYPLFPINDRAEAVNAANTFVGKIEKECQVYPVREEDVMAKVLYVHRTTELSTWNTY